VAALASFLGLAFAAVLAAAALLTWWGSAPFPPGRRSDRLPEALVVRGLLAEWMAASAALLPWPLGLPSARSDAGAAHGVVLLLPDVGMNRTAFWLLARRLRRAGWRTAHARACRWTTPADQRCPALAAEIQNAAGVVAGKPVVLLAHGVAGLAARECLAASPTVRQLMTLGTPHQGTTSGPYRWLAPETDPGSARMGRLGEAARPVDGLEVITISSPFDAWTNPASAADYPGAFNIEVSAIGHFRLLFSRRVFELIAENLPADQADRR
jgi:hypothetical protein